MQTRLLIIDDDLSALFAVGELLQRGLHDVVTDIAPNAQAALYLLVQNDYHVVISDIRMGGLDGLVLLNQVRERWPEVPVILVTAAGREREREAFRQGAYFFLEKPVDVEKLLAAVQAAIDRSLMLYRKRRLRKLLNDSNRIMDRADARLRQSDDRLQNATRFLLAVSKILTA